MHLACWLDTAQYKIAALHGSVNLPYDADWSNQTDKVRALARGGDLRSLSAAVGTEAASDSRGRTGLDVPSSSAAKDTSNASSASPTVYVICRRCAIYYGRIADR